MATLQLAYNNSAITQIGNNITATAFNTGFRVNASGNNCTYDFFFTGADTVQLNGGLYAATGDLVVTLMDTSGNVLNTVTPTLTTHVFTVQTVNYFTGLTPATTYWLRLSYAGFGNQIIQSDALVQLSGASTTPSVSTVTGYNPTQIYTPTAAFDGTTNITGKVGLEGAIVLVSAAAGEAVWASGVTGQAGYAGGKIRFKGSFTNIYVRQYANSSNFIHLQSVPLNGSSGVPTHIATVNNPASGVGKYGPWQLLASGLSNTSLIYELVFQGNNAGALLADIMTSGGTGIDLTTTTAALTRSQYHNTVGDSIVAQDYPSASVVCWLMETEGISQTLNKAVLNVGVDGISMATISTTPSLITALTTGPVPSAGITIRGGINDVNSGSPPSVATLSGYLASIINQIRAKGAGWATCAINVEGMLPTSAQTYAYLNNYNKGTGGYKDTVTAFNNGTISGQSPNPDPNVFYRDVDTMQLGGAAYATGGAFDNTNYVDGLHPNTAGGAIIKTFQLNYLSPPTPPVVETTTGFAYGFGSYAADSFSGLVGSPVIYNFSISESVAASSSFALPGTFNYSISELVTASDSLAINGSYSFSIIETVTASDNMVFSNGMFNYVFTETVTAHDTISFSTPGTLVPASRTYLVPDQPEAFNIAIQSSVDNLDYKFDWSSYLQADIIVSSAFTLHPSGINVVNTFVDSTKQGTVFFVNGGVIGQNYIVTNTITTLAGLTRSETLIIAINEVNFV